MRRFVGPAIAAFFMLAGCMGLLTACSPAQIPPAESSMQEWLATAALDAHETTQTLYQAAMQEDTLVVYSTTTRIHRVKESFEAAYPGLTVEVYDARGHDLVDMVLNEYEAGTSDVDVIICANDNMSLSTELLSQGLIYKYVPWDIAPALVPKANSDLLYFTLECEQLVYNTEVYDACPIQNWWQLTEPQWYGKVYMNSPLRSFPAYALLHSVLQNSAEMEKAYEMLYGEALILPPGKTAGQVFWERLVENGLQLTTSSNEIVEIVGASGQTDPPVAFMISSKVRRTEIGLHVAAAYGVAPCDGIYSANSVSIAGGAKNVNTAKLFIRWLLGETDGTGEGLKPYLANGTWSAREDVQSATPVALEDMNVWYNSPETVVQTADSDVAFWKALAGADTVDLTESE